MSRKKRLRSPVTYLQRLSNFHRINSGAISSELPPSSKYSPVA
ncbi:MAG TPA: hypothetical protein V6D14_33585 [Coleofasciculaceae cyanobacterium]